jgi:tetratricopeptide (TPR) repeat protein
MQSLLNFVKHPEDATTNFNLAHEYETLQQIPAAISFYLRAAERGDDSLAYDCLIRIADLLKKQGNRENSVEHYLKQSIALNPSDYQAYYNLSKLYEEQKNWQDCYLISTIGYNATSSVYLKFQLALASWWCHKPEESRSLFKDLAFNDWYSLDAKHRTSVQRNLSSLGSGPESQAFTPYFKSQHDDLRMKFEHSEKIVQNYSQVYQDIFVLMALNGQKSGTFLEIGGSHPFKGNNTALLEQEYDWRGISIELDESLARLYKQQRPNIAVLCRDATEIDYKSLLKEYDVIDYLQLDIEPSDNTFKALLSIPFEEVKFKVITYEHDHYIDRTQSYRDKSRRYLKSLGYELLVGDISPDGKSSFEDWWVHPAYIDSVRLQHLKVTNKSVISAFDYIFDKSILA